MTAVISIVYIAKGEAKQNAFSIKDAIPLQ